MCGPNLTAERKAAKQLPLKGNHELANFKWEFLRNQIPELKGPWVTRTSHCKMW